MVSRVLSSAMVMVCVLSTYGTSVGVRVGAKGGAALSLMVVLIRKQTMDSCRAPGAAFGSLARFADHGDRGASTGQWTNSDATSGCPTSLLLMHASLPKSASFITLYLKRHHTMGSWEMLAGTETGRWGGLKCR